MAVVNPSIPAVPPIPPWTRAGRRAVATRLGRIYGEEMAREIARHVLEPESLAQAIGRWNDGTGEYVGGDYTIFDVFSGRITLVEAKMPVAALVPDPTNGRVAGATHYPIADAHSTVMPRIRRWDIDPDRGLVGALTTRAPTIETAGSVVGAVKQALSLNKGIKQQIAEQTILDAIIGLPTKIRMTDGSASRVVVLEGNTRVGAALDYQGLPHHVGLLGLQQEPGVTRKRAATLAMQDEATRDDRLVDAHREVEELAARKASLLDVAELRRVRTWVVKVLLPIAWEPHPHAEDVTLVDGLHEYLERRHVRPPSAWHGDASVAWDSADVLDALERNGYITESQMYLWSGERPEGAAAPPMLDDLAVEVQEIMASAAFDEDLKRLLRAHVEQKYLTDRARARLIVSLVLRQRAIASPTLYRAVASAYERGLTSYKPVWNRFVAVEERDPFVLADTAIRGLGGARSAPEADHLVLRALPYLVLHEVLKRETTHDTRSPATLLEELTTSERGLLFLAETITRGREGRSPVRVDQAGLSHIAADGAERPADDKWLRTVFLPSDAQKSEEEEGTDAKQASAPMGPEDQEQQAVRDITELLTKLTDAIKSLGDMPISGNPPDGEEANPGDGTWVRAHGVYDSKDEVEKKIHSLQSALVRLQVWIEHNRIVRGVEETDDAPR